MDDLDTCIQKRLGAPRSQFIWIVAGVDHALYSRLDYSTRAGRRLSLMIAWLQSDQKRAASGGFASLHQSNVFRMRAAEVGISPFRHQIACSIRDHGSDHAAWFDGTVSPKCDSCGPIHQLPHALPVHEAYSVS